MSQIAVRVCDEVLGKMPRDRTTLDALEVARVLLAVGPNRMSKQQTRIWDYMDTEFTELAFHGSDAHGWTWELARHLWEEKVALAFEVAWGEVQRRDNYGQDVEPKLEDLTFELLKEML
jgi:hypothetical protein